MPRAGRCRVLVRGAALGRGDESVAGPRRCGRGAGLTCGAGAVSAEVPWCICGLGDEIDGRLPAGLGVPVDGALTADLSGGERQHTAVTSALMSETSLLLADEPTGALDEQARDQVADVLLDAPRRPGCGLLAVTHDASVAERADRVLRSSQGRLAGPQTEIVPVRRRGRCPGPARCRSAWAASAVFTPGTGPGRNGRGHAMDTAVVDAGGSMAAGVRIDGRSTAAAPRTADVERT